MIFYDQNAQIDRTVISGKPLSLLELCSPDVYMRAESQLPALSLSVGNSKNSRCMLGSRSLQTLLIFWFKAYVLSFLLPLSLENTSIG